jgi:hypothetical protein
VAPTSAHLSIPSTIFRPATPATASLEKDINDVRTAMEEFKSKQLKYTKKDGTVIPLSETIDSVLNRIRQYTNIGNIMVQSDPAIAALAWGGFNLLLQVTKYGLFQQQTSF